jgi:hypothetical protein
MHEANFDTAKFESQYPSIEQRLVYQANTGWAGVSTSLHDPDQLIPGAGKPGAVAQVYTLEVPVENVVMVRQENGTVLDLQPNQLNLLPEVREHPERFLFIEEAGSPFGVGESIRGRLNEENEGIFVGNFVPNEFVVKIQSNSTGEWLKADSTGTTDSDPKTVAP